MGAYENPEQLVDTQTGQHLRNLQTTIAGAFSGYAKTYAEKEIEQQTELKKQQAINAKKLNEDQKEVDNYALSLRTKMGDAQRGNKELDLSATFEPLIQEAVKLKSGLLNGSIKDRQSAIARIAKINGSVTGFTESLAEFDTYSNDLENLMLKPIGSEGGLSKDMPAVDIKPLRIMQGKLPGYKKAVYEDNDPDKLVWEIYEPGGTTPIKRYYASKMKELDIYGDGDFISPVPDMSESNEKLKNTVNTIFETKTQLVKGQEVTESTGRLTDIMLTTKKDQPQEIDYQKEYIGGQPGVYKLVAKVDKTKVMENNDLKVLLKGRVAGMTDSEIIIYNNNILADNIKGAPMLERTKALTGEQREKFLENYKEHFWNTQVSHKQDLLREDSSVQTFQDPKEIKPKAPKSIAPTGTQRNQADFNARIKEVIDTGEGGVSKGGYTFMKMDGKWGVYDKDGLPKPGTENITNPTTLATFIGGTLKKPLK